jgi:hypothetical protein
LIFRSGQEQKEEPQHTSVAKIDYEVEEEYDEDGKLRYISRI